MAENIINCYIEVGDSVKQPYDGFKSLHTGKWWWYIQVAGRCTIEGAKSNYGSKGSAVRAARRWAERCRLDVTDVYEQD